MKNIYNIDRINAMPENRDIKYILHCTSSIDPLRLACLYKVNANNAIWVDYQKSKKVYPVMQNISPEREQQFIGINLYPILTSEQGCTDSISYDQNLYNAEMVIAKLRGSTIVKRTVQSINHYLFPTWHFLDKRPKDLPEQRMQLSRVYYDSDIDLIVL